MGAMTREAALRQAAKETFRSDPTFTQELAEHYRLDRLDVPTLDSEGRMLSIAQRQRMLADKEASTLPDESAAQPETPKAYLARLEQEKAAAEPAPMFPESELAVAFEKELHKDTTARPITGGSNDYYKLPEGATELADLIEAKNMNFAVGNIFKAAYRLGEKQGNTVLYDLEKIIWFAEREIARHKRDCE